MVVTPAEALQTYSALHLHFTSSGYNYHTYNGKLKYKVDFTKRRDKLQLQKIAKHSDAFNLILSNIVSNPNIWTTDIVSDAGFERYDDWKKRNDFLLVTFTKDLKELDKTLVDSFRIKDGQHPKALKRFLGGFISIETLSIMNSLTNYWGHWNTNLKEDLIWKEIALTIPKYQSFLRFNKTEVKQAIKERSNASGGANC